MSLKPHIDASCLRKFGGMSLVNTQRYSFDFFPKALKPRYMPTSKK